MHYQNKTDNYMNYCANNSRTKIDDYFNKLDVNKDEDRDDE